MINLAGVQRGFHLYSDDPTLGSYCFSMSFRPETSLAKVGVVSSNLIARSNVFRQYRPDAEITFS